MFNKLYILILVIPLFLVGCGSQTTNDQDVDKISGNLSCSQYEVEACPNDCVVCPPAMESSSISCQSEEFCAELGIDRDWHNKMTKRINGQKFNDCVLAGNPVMESYPRQCRIDENTYTEYIGNEMEKMDLIRLDNPRPNSVIDSPLILSGEAMGNWYFEGDFPIELRSAEDVVIAKGFATAQGEWMTDSFVQFTAEIEFVKPGSKYGTLILKKDNPSDLAENYDSLEVPVFFH
jgi:Immunoglobulin-like domain of bacterial spore germination